MGDFNIVGEVEENRALLSTPEYRRMISLLGYPRDLFHEKHPKKTGYTWDADANTMIPKSDEGRLRLDYILAFDRIPPLVPEQAESALRPVHCRQAQVQTFQSDNNADLSDHYAVDVTIEIGPAAEPIVA